MDGISYRPIELYIYSSKNIYKIQQFSVDVEL